MADIQIDASDDDAFNSVYCESEMDWFNVIIGSVSIRLSFEQLEALHKKVSPFFVEQGDVQG